MIAMPSKILMMMSTHNTTAVKCNAVGIAVMVVLRVQERHMCSNKVNSFSYEQHTNPVSIESVLDKMDNKENSSSE